MVLIQHSVISDWLFNTQPRVLQAEWFILEINEKVTLNINIPINESEHLDCLCVYQTLVHATALSSQR